MSTDKDRKQGKARAYEVFLIADGKELFSGRYLRLYGAGKRENDLIKKYGRFGHTTKIKPIT